MTALVDEDYYAQNFMGLSYQPGVWQRYERAAEDVINDLCGNYFDTHTLSNLQLVTDGDRVKRAVCAQIEFYVDQGGISPNERAKAQNQPKSFTVGNFSMTNGTTASTKVAGAGEIDVRVLRYLQPTGLLYRGVHQYD
jgi:hypothetical protein